MPKPQLADRIRAYAYDNIVAPGLESRAAVSVRTGDVHNALGLQQRARAVCRALSAHIFEDLHGLRRLAESGPPDGMTTTYVFADAAAESAAGRGPALTDEHRETLDWFAGHAREVVPWTTLNSGDLLKAVSAKGIYRPTGWRHALSVKIIPSGPYPDELPETHEPGLVFRYHQEEVARSDPATERSNLGLANCLRDRVPVGIVRQVKGGVGAQYEVVGVGRVLEWRDRFFSIQILAAPGEAVARASADSADEPPPISDEDARQKVLRSIAVRRGQAKFRQTLLEAYGRRCAVSGCDVEAVLEAAHIVGYLGDHTNVVTNGLLLRADLHMLFDLGLLRIEPETRRVVLSEALRGSEYGAYHNRILREPAMSASRPAAEVLLRAWQSSAPE